MTHFQRTRTLYAKLTKTDTLAGLAFGSNLSSCAGNSTETLNEALRLIRKKGVGRLKVSRFFRNPAWPPGSGPDFVNAAAVIETVLPAHALLELLHRVEAQLGRVRQERWGPRPIDIDLIFRGDAVLPDRATFQAWAALPKDRQAQEAPDRMILPHPRMHERGFVLIPLADVAPDWRHPVLGRTVAEMAAALPAELVRDVRPLGKGDGAPD